MSVSLDTRVQQLSGDIVVDEEVLHHWYEDGGIDIFNRIKIINPNLLPEFSTTTRDITGALGISIEQTGSEYGSLGIAYVERNGYPCTEIPQYLASKAADPNSIYYATKKHPVYYIARGYIYILPAPSTDETGHVYTYASPRYMALSSEDDVIYFPSKYNHLVVLYAAMQNVLSKISNISIPQDVVIPAVPVFDGLSSVSQSLPTFETVDRLTLPTVPSIEDIDFSSIDYIPVFVYPVSISLPELDLGSDLNINSFTQSTSAPTPPSISIGDGSVDSFSSPPEFISPVLTLSDIPEPDNISLPTSPSIDSYITVSETLPTWTTVSSPSLPTAPSDTNIDFSSVPSAPAFNPPSLLVLPAVPDIDVTLSKSLSDISAISDISLPTLTLPSAPTIPDLTISATPPTAPSAPSYHSNTVSIGTPLPTYTHTNPWISFTTILSDISTYIDTDEDVELASAKLQQMKLDIDAMLAEIQDELNSFNSTISNYKAELEKQIAEYKYILDVDNSEYIAELQRYNAQINDYAAQVNAEVAEYVNTYINTDLRVWEIQVQSAIAEYQAKSGAEIQKYIASTKAGTSEAEALIYSTELQKISLENNLKLQKYSEVVASKVNEYKVELDKAVQDYTADFKVWETEITKAINTYQAETGYDLNKYVSEVQAVLGEHTANLNNEAQQFKSNLDKYIANLQYVNTTNDRVLNKYVADINKYNAEVNATLQKWSLENIQAIQAKLIAIRQTDISKYQLDIQNALNKFNEANTEYQADIQKKMLEATNSLTSDIETVKAELNKYSEQLAQYQIDVNTEIQEYLQKDVQAELTEWVEKRRNLLEEFKIKSDNAINRYNSEVNEAINKYQLDIQIWSKQIDQILTKYNLETSFDVEAYKSEVQALIGKYTEDINNAAATFNAGLSNYQAEVDKINSENNSKLAEYSADIQLFNAQVNAEISKAQVNLQKVSIEQNKYIELYKSLRTQYEQGFLPFQIRSDRGYQSINPII